MNKINDKDKNKRRGAHYHKLSGDNKHESKKRTYTSPNDFNSEYSFKRDEYKNLSDDNTEDLNSYSDEYSKGSKYIGKNPYREDKKWIKKARKEEKKRLKESGRQNRIFFRLVWISMVVIVSVILSQYIMVGVNDMLAIDRKEQNTVAISIPKDLKIYQIANILSVGKVINNPNFFTIYAAVIKPNTRFTKGQYEIKTDMEYEEIISYLQTQGNRTDIEDVTFAEGLSIIQYADLLSEKGICNRDKFLQKCNSSDFDEDYEFLKSIPNPGERYYKLEGYLYPDTYTFYQDIDPDIVIEKCLSNYKKRILNKKTIEGYTEPASIENLANKKEMTADKLLILASMVQAEAADSSDMKIISSIFFNRLKSDPNKGFMYLNSDPTVFYPYKNKESMPSGFESSYDTYKNPGLPKGPICNPGMEAIDAVLNPADTQYMYFCHDRSGKAYYARTQAGHEENLVKAGLKSDL